MSTRNKPLPDKEQVRRDITSLVKKLLRCRGPKKAELARVLGMEPDALSHALHERNGRTRYWKPHEVLALSRYYDVPIDAFLGDPDALEEVRIDLRWRFDQELDDEF